MLFFQVGLLVGYTYAHLLVSRFRDQPTWQAGIHLGLLAISIALLPITPADSLRPTGGEISPMLGILRLLICSVGLPYIVVSASGPLLQHWFAESAKGISPYRLYAVSNAGSLLGLLTYPIFFEPTFGLARQTGLWSIAYVVYAMLAGVCAWRFIKVPAAVSESAAHEVAPAARPSCGDGVLWVALAACGSLLLLATTSQMCQDVAVVPFLWVLPLSLYLLTFIIAFDHARWYSRLVWISLVLLSISALVIILSFDFGDNQPHMSIQIGIYALSMFAACMVCHGEMVRLKPHPRYLTSFYLAVSLGGALGGVFVSLIAPQIFSGYWELHVGLVAFMVLAGFCLFRNWRRSHLVATGAIAWAAAILVMAHFLRQPVSNNCYIEAVRGFYGVLQVYESGAGTQNHSRSLYNGRIKHGGQFLRDPFRAHPYSYYAAKSGPGLLFRYHPKRQKDLPATAIKIGVVGLGVGTLAAYAKPGDSVRIYEINPQVEELARSQFSYLADCKGELSVVLGDARIILEQELAVGDKQQFDVFFLDAFSGDSIPIHLLTREAFALYFSHLNPDGVLVVHITNSHLDLGDPVRILARELGKEVLQIERNPRQSEWVEHYSRWVLIGDNRKLFDAIEAGGWRTAWEAEPTLKRAWTDDYSNLLEVIDWEGD
jgi:hypothetical protein